MGAAQEEGAGPRVGKRKKTPDYDLVSAYYSALAEDAERKHLAMLGRLPRPRRRPRYRYHEPHVDERTGRTAWELALECGIRCRIPAPRDDTENVREEVNVNRFSRFRRARPV